MFFHHMSGSVILLDVWQEESVRPFQSVNISEQTEACK